MDDGCETFELGRLEFVDCILASCGRYLELIDVM